MAYIRSCEMIFYTLQIEDCKEEDLRDFLEDKMCRILNLPRTCEYELLFNNALGKNTYSCLLIAKENIQKHITKKTTILSHNIFYAQQFVRENKLNDFTFFVLRNLEKTYDFVGFLKGEIISFQSIQKEEIQEKIIEAKEEFNKEIKLFFYGEKALDGLENTEFIEKLPPIASQNFAPLKQPFSRNFYYGLVACVFGIFFGCFSFVFSSFLAHKIQRENEMIASQIENLERENKNAIEAYKNNQRQWEILQEKQAQLEIANKTNKEILKSKNKTLNTFKKLSEMLVRNDLKLFYLDYQKELIRAVVYGDMNAWNKKDFYMNHLEKIGDFYQLEIKNK